MSELLEEGEDTTAVGRYTYRRRSETRDLLTAAGIGLGVGVAAFYVASLLIRRTPLVPRPPRVGLPTTRKLDG